MVSVVILLSALLSVAPATASEASKDLKTFASHYLGDSKMMFGQGYFVGLVTGRAVGANICMEPGTINGVIFSAVAGVVLTDPVVDKIKTESEIIDYALLKSFPCTNL